MKIDVGGGKNCWPGWTNLDPVHGEGLWKRVAQDAPWPTGACTVTTIHASHVLEHIPAGQARIDVFNEAHRVLVPDGRFEVIVPLLCGTCHAVADPTHVSFWVRESFLYFTHQIEADADYGILPWREISWEARDGWEGHWVGTK